MQPLNWMYLPEKEDANWQEIFGKPFGTSKALGFFEKKGTFNTIWIYPPVNLWLLFFWDWLYKIVLLIKHFSYLNWMNPHRPVCFCEISKENHMNVSKHRGTPKSSMLIGSSIIFIIHLGGNTPIFGNIHIGFRGNPWRDSPRLFSHIGSPPTEYPSQRSICWPSSLPRPQSPRVTSRPGKRLGWVSLGIKGDP